MARGTLHFPQSEAESFQLSPSNETQFEISQHAGEFKAGTVVANETSIFFHPNFSASDSFAMKIVLLRCAVAFQPNCFVCLCFGFLWVDPTTAKQRFQIVLNAPFYVRAINMPWNCIACGCLNNCITGFSKIHFTTRAMEQSASAAIL